MKHILFVTGIEKKCLKVAYLGIEINKQPVAGVTASYHGTSLVDGPAGLKAWSFVTGLQSVVKFTGSPVNINGGSFTMAGFVYQDVTKDGPIVEWTGASGIEGAHVWIWQSKLYTNLMPGGTGQHYVASHAIVSAKAWHFIGVSYDQDTSELVMWVDDNVLVKNTGTPQNPLLKGDVVFGKTTREGGRKIFNFIGKMSGITVLGCSTKKDQIGKLKSMIEETAKYNTSGKYEYYLQYIRESGGGVTAFDA